jgi:hypothetical protein
MTPGWFSITGSGLGLVSDSETSSRSFLILLIEIS